MFQFIRDFIFPKAYDLSARTRGRGARVARPAGPVQENGETRDAGVEAVPQRG